MAVRFTFLGHATVRCDLPGGEVVLIDPWVEGNPACELANDGFERIDAMLLTHGHFDHIGDVVALARAYRPQIVAGTPELCTWLESQGVGNTAGMNLGGTQEVLGQQVTMVQAMHSSGISTDGGIVPGGVASGYVVRLDSGLCFYHAGDTSLFSDMQLIGELYRPQLAFLPIGDHFTMDPRQAAWATRFLQVRHVVPIHWGTFPVLTGTPERFERELADLGVECDVVRLEPGESYAP